MFHIISRREVLVSLISGAAFVAAGSAFAAGTQLDLKWSDLVPKSEGSRPQIPTGIIQHGQMMSQAPKESAARLTNEFNGKTVRMPGYIVPLDYDRKGTEEFLLVPYVGACIHVPPPPANQLVLVTADEPYEFRYMFEPVYVTGQFNTNTSKTELADVGYALSANKIEPYE